MEIQRCSGNWLLNVGFRVPAVNILHIEDNPRLAELVGAALRRAGYRVDHVANAAEAFAAAKAIQYDLWVLDLGLPDEDGISLLRKLRKSGHHEACLILTARDDLHDRVTGFQAGADDYLTKPFNLEELIARVGALLRRPREFYGQVLEVGNLKYSVSEHQFRVGEELLAIVGSERQALECLVRAKGHRVSRRRLDEYVYGLNQAVTPNALEVLVHRLRKRLKATDASITIKAERGFGYSLVET